MTLSALKAGKMVYINITFEDGFPTIMGPFAEFTRAYAYIYKMQELGKNIVYDVFQRGVEQETTNEEV